MKQYLIILTLAAVTNISIAQQVQMLDLNVSCNHVENTDGKREFPLVYEQLAVEVEWLVSLDSVIEEVTSAKFNINETIGGLLFTGFFGAQAMNVHTGDLIAVGEGKFRETFQPDEFILLKDIGDNVINFIQLATGDTLHKIESYTSVLGYQFFSDTLYYGNTRDAIFAYSLSSKRKVWEKKSVGRYNKLYGPEGDGSGVLFYHKYSNYRTDSTQEKMYFVSTGDWKEIEIKAADPYVGFSAIDGNTFYFYGRENKYYSVEIPTFKVNWCISGGWKRPFIKKDNKWIATNHEVDELSGEVTITNNYAWNHIFSEWGDYYVLTAFDGDADYLYLASQDYKKIYRPTFLFDGELPCNLEQVISDGKIRIANTADKDKSVAYFNCNGKTYFMGVKINLESAKN